jgi:hypothetical protein
MWLGGVASAAIVQGYISTSPHMANGEWMTQRERKQTRDAIREEARRLKIEWTDKLWLCQNHPVDDAVLAWLSENRAEASKIGSSRWNLETLPGLVERQAELRKAAAFEEVLQRASVSTQTVTVRDVLAGFPQVQPVENEKTPRRNRGRRQPSRKRSSQSA